jgi:acetate kinase
MLSSAYLYAVPMSLCRDYGVRRYGFHDIRSDKSMKFALLDAKRDVAQGGERAKRLSQASESVADYRSGALVFS